MPTNDKDIRRIRLMEGRPSQLQRLLAEEQSAVEELAERLYSAWYRKALREPGKHGYKTVADFYPEARRRLGLE